MTRCSLQSQYGGDFLTNAAAKREFEFKRQWLEAKREEDTQEADDRADLEARLQRKEFAQREIDEEFDPNLVTWDKDDPGNPQNRE